MAKDPLLVADGRIARHDASGLAGFHAFAAARRRFGRWLTGVICLLTVCLEGTGFPSKHIINTVGPITRVTVGRDGALQIEHQEFPGMGQIYPKMVSPADCGFFLRHNGKVVGIDYLNHDGTMAYSTQAAPFNLVSQAQSTDGQLVRTVMDNSTDGTGVPFRVTQSVSYLPSDSWILVSVAVQNESVSAQTVDLFAAADIYVANEDNGYALLNTNIPQVAIGGASYARTFNLFVQAVPGSPQPTAYQEDLYATIWNIIGNGQHFADTIDPEYHDNGAGLEWQGVAIPAGSSFSVSYYWACGTNICVEPVDRPQPIRILWAGGTNMLLHWDQPGYFLQASSNSLCDWATLPVPTNSTEVTVPIDLQQSVFYRLARP